MKIRLLTDGGYIGTEDCVGKIVEAKPINNSRNGLVEVYTYELNKVGGEFECNYRISFTKDEYELVPDSEPIEEFAKLCVSFSGGIPCDGYACSSASVPTFGNKLCPIGSDLCGALTKYKYQIKGENNG